MQTATSSSFLVSACLATAFLTACGSLPADRAPSNVPALRNASAQTSSRFSVIYAFEGGKKGEHPWAPLINVNGTLYGTTYGSFGSGPKSAGTIYRITTSGTETVLHAFAGYPHHDGSSPQSALLNVKGILYGTTYNGGGGGGTVFEISASGGSYEILHNFGGSYFDGIGPEAGLIDLHGTLYGTTVAGCPSYWYCILQGRNFGTFYSITTSGVEKPLHYFTAAPRRKGTNPEAPVIDVGGTMYGTTAANNGMVYSIDTTGKAHRLHYFCCGSHDGWDPVAPVLALNGVLYGTTMLGGHGSACKYGCGTVFALPIAQGRSKYRILHSFLGGADGAYPAAGLIAVNGTLYGTTEQGGGSANCGGGCGTIFSITPSGTEAVVHSFAGNALGSDPQAALLDVNSTLYGTTFDGGSTACAAGCGTVFAFKP